MNIWPWTTIKAHKLDADRLHAMNDRLEKKLNAVELHNRILKTEVGRLTDLLGNAHFRNPKTGLIGKKGQRFK